MDQYSHSTGVSDNVRRQTIEDTRKRIMIYARVSIQEYEKIQEMKRIRGTSNESQIIREAINTYHGLLSGMKEIRPASNVIIQNPIVNMNINNNLAEAKPQINININMEALEELLEFLEWIAYQSAYPNAVKKRAMKYERTVRALLRDLSKLN